MEVSNHKKSRIHQLPKLKWNQLNPMPFQTWYASSCLIDGVIYIFGGTHPDQFTSTTIQLFNPKTNKWNLIEKQFEMPTPRFRHSSHELNGIAFLIGGWNQQ